MKKRRVNLTHEERRLLRKNTICAAALLLGLIFLAATADMWADWLLGALEVAP